MVNHAARLASQEVLMAEAVGAPVEEIGAQVAAVAGVVRVGACQNTASEDQLSTRGFLCVFGFLVVRLDEPTQLCELLVNGRRCLLRRDRSHRHEG